MQVCLVKCVHYISTERLQNQKQITAYYCLPTRNERHGLVVITTSLAETLQASSDQKGKWPNKHIFYIFNIHFSHQVILFCKTETKFKERHLQKTDSNRKPANFARAVFRAKTGWFLWPRQTQTTIMLQTVSPKAKDNLPQQVPIIGYFWQDLVLSYIMPNLFHLDNEKNVKPI